MQVFEYQQTQDLGDNEWVEIPKSTESSPEKKKPNLPILTMPEEQKLDILEDPDEEELQMIYDKGEELVGKAKDLMQSLKARVSFSMSQKKANRE